MRRGALRSAPAAVAALAALLLAGCAAPERSAAPAPIYSGLAGAVLRWCAADVSPRGFGGAVVTATSRSWSWTTATVQLRGGADLEQRVLEVGLVGAPAPADRAAADRVASCMRRVAFDWSISRDDSTAVRSLLYPWYRDRVDPCLRTAGQDPMLPSPDRFAAATVRYDPFTAVTRLSPSAARRLQHRCVPAPPDVITAARLRDAARIPGT